MDWMEDDLAKRRQSGLYRRRRHVQSGPGSHIRYRGREFLNFASNDYLNLAADPRLARAAARAARRYGCGAGASPLVSGYLPPHRALERALASWEQTEAALVFSSGFAANLAVVASLVGREDAIFSDELNHASLIDGCRLSRARVHIYRHRDADHLRELLRDEGPKGRRRLIVTESVFSMDGDLAPLAELWQLAQEFDCLLLVDEAHATGVLCADGRGLSAELPRVVAGSPPVVTPVEAGSPPSAVEAGSPPSAVVAGSLPVVAGSPDPTTAPTEGLPEHSETCGQRGWPGQETRPQRRPQREVTKSQPPDHANRLVKVGTLSKALGAQGGFVCGARRLVDYLVNHARPYIFSTALASPAAAAARAALTIAAAEPERRRHVLQLADQLRTGLRGLGWPESASRCQIVPVIVGDARASVELSARLEEQGLLVPAIRPPSVPDGTARLRISLTAGHTEADVNRLIAALGAARPSATFPR